MADHPAKSDIQAIFKRLRSIPTNKQCFDCGSSNPTWASITYGVFLCIDCSAVHRSLGVHVTFIRSTQLDTNWSWLQLRAMQMGGNANAIGFFRQHGCTTKDAQQKYHSRAATMYKDKLHALATHALRLHGTKLHIDSVSDPSSPEYKEVDFFAEHSENVEEPESESFPMSEGQKLASAPVPIENGNLKKEAPAPVPTDSGEGPSVEHALSMSPTQAQAQAEPRKSLIGAKKQPARKGKGGLGAQKVKTNFTEIENRAQQKDKDRELLAANKAQEEAKTKEDQEKQMASMRLAYQDMSMERKKQEERLKQSDPKKAEQMERLGMGFGGSRGISHSALSDMKTIEQEGGKNNKLDLDNFERRNKNNFFEDELDSYGGSSGFSSGPPKYDSPFGSSRNKNDDFGGWGNSNKDSGWGMDRFDSKQETFSESITSKQDDRPTRTRKTAVESSSTTEDAQKKFGNAKSISSDQYFGKRDMDFETQQNLSKFEGSSSISSADLFGDDRQKSRSSYGSNAPDIQDIKDGVRQGVTKVAGRISNIASGVMSSLQDRYGS